MTINNTHSLSRARPHTYWCRRRDFDAAQEDAALAHLQDCLSWRVAPVGWVSAKAGRGRADAHGQHNSPHAVRDVPRPCDSCRRRLAAALARHRHCGRQHQQHGGDRAMPPLFIRTVTSESHLPHAQVRAHTIPTVITGTAAALQEGSIRRRWPRARRRAHHDLRCLCRETAEAP